MKTEFIFSVLFLMLRVEFNESKPMSELEAAKVLEPINQRFMMKRKKTGSNSTLTNNAAAEAEEKARLEASTSGERREGRGYGTFFAPMGLVPHFPYLFEALQTTTPRPEPEIVSRKKRGFGQSIAYGSMVIQPFIPMIVDALKQKITTTPPLQAAPLHQFQQQPYNYHQPLSNNNPYALVNGQSPFANLGNEEYQSIFHNSWKNPGINYHYPNNPQPQQFAHDFYMKNHQQIKDLVKQNQLQAETVRNLNELVEAYIRKDTTSESTASFAVTEEVTASNSTLTTASPLRKTTILPHCQEKISCCNVRGETYKIITCSKP